MDGLEAQIRAEIACLRGITKFEKIVNLLHVDRPQPRYTLIAHICILYSHKYCIHAILIDLFSSGQHLSLAM